MLDFDSPSELTLRLGVLRRTKWNDIAHVKCFAVTRRLSKALCRGYGTHYVVGDIVSRLVLVRNAAAHVEARAETFVCPRVTAGCPEGHARESTRVCVRAAHFHSTAL